MFRAVLDALSTWTIPVLLAGIPLLALVRRVKLYPAFLEGAKAGFETAVRIIPPLVAVFVLLAMLRASGAMDAAAEALAPVTSAIGIPPSVLPLVLVRPLSGAAPRRAWWPTSCGPRDLTPGPGGWPRSWPAPPRPPSTCWPFTWGRPGSPATGRRSRPGSWPTLAGFTAAVIVCRLMFGG